ncbi:MAG TPA: flavodoxin family protein [Syntrophales bacterium]|nr:flavodoxin family protein [Syntrophales bacterium]
MKILGINASPKGSKSQTLRLVKAALDGAKSKGAEVEFIDLCKLKIEYCNACGICHKKGRCYKKDDFQELYRKILAADGLVMGSPNYFLSVTAQMKTLIDRMAYAVHCQLFSGKYAVNVATSGGVGRDRQVTTYLDKLMLTFGCFITGSAGVSVRLGSEAMEAAERKSVRLGVKLAEDVRTRRVYPKQEKIHQETREYFRQLVAMNKNEWTHEHEFWNRISKGLSIKR